MVGVLKVAQHRSVRDPYQSTASGHMSTRLHSYISLPDKQYAYALGNTDPSMYIGTQVWLGHTLQSERATTVVIA